MFTVFKIAINIYENVGNTLKSTTGKIDGI